MGIDDIIEDLKNIEWEKKSKSTVMRYRYAVFTLKIVPMYGQIAAKILKEVLRGQLVGSSGHAKDQLAIRLFNHYLNGYGANFF